MRTNDRPFDGRTFIVRETVEYAVTLEPGDCLHWQDGHQLSDEELRALAEEKLCGSSDPFAEFHGEVTEREVYEE